MLSCDGAHTHTHTNTEQKIIRFFFNYFVYLHWSSHCFFFRLSTGNKNCFLFLLFFPPHFCDCQIQVYLFHLVYVDTKFFSVWLPLLHICIAIREKLCSLFIGIPSAWLNWVEWVSCVEYRFKNIKNLSIVNWESFNFGNAKHWLYFDRNVVFAKFFSFPVKPQNNRAL